MQRLPIVESKKSAPIVLACMAGETHTLGLEALRAALGQRGGALMLGADVPTCRRADAPRAALTDPIGRRSQRASVVFGRKAVNRPTFAACVDRSDACIVYASIRYNCGVSDTASAASDELVVLVDEQGKQIGTAAKASVHHAATPLHLAFSCYLFDGAGRVLLTRRALGKRTWPGVWTNSFCGHPLPGERTVDAVRRRGRQELGLRIDEAECVLPDFRYRAVAADGTVENEICPVFCANADDSVRPAPDEVMDYRWLPWRDVRRTAGLPWAVSPWAREQIPLLDGSTYIDHELPFSGE